KAKAKKASHCCGPFARKKRAWRSEAKRHGKQRMEDGWTWSAGDCTRTEGRCVERWDPWDEQGPPNGPFVRIGDCHGRLGPSGERSESGANEGLICEDAHHAGDARAWGTATSGTREESAERGTDDELASMEAKRAELTTSEVVVQFRGFNAEKFSGQGDPRLVEEWIQGLESIFEITEYTDRHRILCAQLQMTGDARLWWNSYWGMRPGEKEHLTWIQFKEMLEEKYYPAHYRAEMECQFLALVQGNRSVGEYKREFTKLGSFV
ncbi:Unknown protein, partial [Striga hermonthica]